MAIKVRHDGNVAPIAAAGVAGGRARKNMDAAKLANFGRSGTSGGGGGGGGAINPGTAHAPTSSASLSSAPAPRPSLERQTAAQDWLAERSDQRRFDNQSALQRESDERSLAAKRELADQANQFQTERDAAQNKFVMERDAALNGYQTERDAQAQKNRLAAIGAETEAWKNRTDYAYTAKQRQQYADLQGIRDTLVNSKLYSKEDIDRMMPEIEMRMKGIRDSPERMLPQDRRPVPELQISPDGKFYFDDARGGWTPMPREQTQGPAGPTPEQSYKLRELGAAQKTYQDELRAWKRAKADYDKGVGEDPGPMPEFDETAALERIGGMWNSVMGQPAPADASQPQPQPQPQPSPAAQTPNPQAIQPVGPNATPEQRAKNWAARLRKQ